jgi:hypothetical protein
MIFCSGGLCPPIFLSLGAHRAPLQTRFSPNFVYRFRRIGRRCNAYYDTLARRRITPVS